MKKLFHQNIAFLFIILLTFVLSEGRAQTYRILPLGNSITVGWNGTSPLLEDAVSYRSELSNQLSSAGYAFDFVGHTSSGWNLMADAEHAGISGTKGQYLSRLLRDGFDLNGDTLITSEATRYLNEFPADIVLLHIGTNDISDGEGISASDVEDILDEIYAWEDSTGNHVAVFVARIIDRTDNILLSNTTHAYNDSIADVVAARVDGSVFLVDQQSGALISYATEMDVDGVHPLQTAFDKMGLNWFNALNTYLLAIPITPGGFSLGGESSASIQLSWSDLSNNETGFEIERSLTGLGEDFSLVYTSGQNTASYTDIGLENETQYFYRIRAINSTGPSLYTSIQTTSTLLAVPDAPTTLIITGVSTNSVTMIWSDQSDNELGFMVERSTESGTNFSVVHTTIAGVQTYTNIGLVENTQYFYRIRAYNSAGISGFTPEANVTTQLSAPSAPGGLYLDNITESSIRLNWVDNSDNESGFEIERSPTPGTGFIRISTTELDVSSFTNTGLDENVTYYYRVRAINLAGNSSYSNEVSETTLLLAPLAPGNMTFSLVAANSMRVQWDDNSDNEANFEVQRSLTLGLAYTDAGSPTTPYFDDSGLDENIEYFYRVRAVNNTAASAWITGSQSTLLLPPTAPDRLSASATNTCSVELTWRDRSTNEDGFEVQRSGLPTSGYTSIWTLPANATAYSDTSARNNEVYYYRIRAFNDAGSVLSGIYAVSVSITLSGGLITDDQILCPGGDTDPILNDVSPSGGSSSWSYQWQSRIAPAAFTDIPGALAISYNPPDNAMFTTEYQRMATVECGSVASNTVIISVDDLEDPEFSVCPADTIVEIERNETVIAFATVDPEVIDNCEVSSLIWVMTGVTTGSSPLTGINLVETAVFQLGITTLTYTAEDLAGNSASCEYIVNVKIKDPEILSVIIPNAIMKIGSTISATIVVADDGGTNYSLLSGSIGGYPLQDFSRISSTTYLANSLVIEGGNSYEALVDIPVENLIVTDGLTPSLPYVTPISQNLDLLDAELPVVTSADLVAGDYKIGDQVVMNILCDGLAYIINPASTINGISVTEPNVTFVEIGLGYYQLIYLVAEGDADIDPGDFIASLIFEKPSGNIGEPFTALGNIDDVWIDANPPLVTRLEVPDEEVGVGGVVVVTITADGTGYKVATGTLINGIPLGSALVDFAEISNGLYALTYEVSGSDSQVSPGGLEISLILTDSAGNNGEAFTIVEDNELEVYTQLPQTHMVALPEICEGVEAELIVYLIGRKPFSFELFDGETTTLFEDVDTSYFTVLLSPLVTTEYSVPLVTDKNGVENTGSLSITIAVNETTPVNITNLASGYNVESDPFQLTADIPGGIFSGPGVNSASGYFDPSRADTINSPHTIYYTYVNPTGCESMDSALVFVLGANGDIYIPASRVCDNSDLFLVSGSNIAGEVGSFTLLDNSEREVAGLTDNGDNTATIDPGMLSAGIFTVEYSYFDAVTLFIRENFELVVLTQPVILSPSGNTTFCQNDDVINLIANDPGAVFTGNGVSGSVGAGFIFDPAVAPEGETSIICTISSNAGCEKTVELLVEVNIASEVEFTVNSSCLPYNGGMVSFNNKSTSKLNVETWRWDFGDPLSGADNYSGDIDPEHFYQSPGSWSISLSATTYGGCVSTYKVDTVFSTSPDTDFTWVSDCFMDSQGVEFINLTPEGLTPVESLKWVFMSESGDLIDEIITETVLDTIEFQFPNAASYLVSLQTVNQGACSDTLTKVLELRRTFKLDAAGYSEAFDLNTGGWTIESSDDNASWVWGTPDFNGFTPQGDGSSWYTDLSSESSDYLEQSWIQSPCFDFSEMDRPMMKLDIMKSFVPNVNGSVLQFMDIRKEGWKTVGANTSGINWYNSFNIFNQPGGSPVGWGLDVFNPDTDWVEAAHDLSSLKDNQFVTLRLAIATNGAQGIGNQGFAFDNFMISEKTKLAVLEHFTNSADDNSFLADIHVDSYAEVNRSEVIDIQYHTAYPGEDPMNQNNPAVASTRAGNLGVGLVPYAVLDGGSNSAYRYDFSSLENSPGAEEVELLSLEIPSFEIDLAVDWTQTNLRTSITVTCMAESYSEYVQLYIVVLETRVTTYEGINGDTEFRNVVLKMLPTPAGKLLGENWYQGVSMNLSNDWTFEPYVEDVDDLAVLAFVQDRNTKEILQAAVEYKTTPTGIRDRFADISELQLYPNPAKDFLYVNLGSRTEKPGVMEVYDLSGRMVLNLETQPGYQIFNLDVQNLMRGMYLVRRMESGELIGRGKFIKSE